MVAERSEWDAISVAGVLWAAAFAVLHLAWAAGGRFALVDHAAADAAFNEPWFGTYNLTVAAASLMLAIAVRTARSHQRAAVRVWSRRLVWFAASVLLLRGAIGAAQLLTVVFSRDDGRALAAWAVDLYMLAGGALLTFVACRFRPDSSHHAKPASPTGEER